VPVRSIAPDDEDFSDLMPLVGWIGSLPRRALGEVTHGDAPFPRQGTAGAVPPQVMGFDVLAWRPASSTFPGRRGSPLRRLCGGGGAGALQDLVEER